MALNIELIRASFAEFKLHTKGDMSYFYDALFKTHPNAAPLFEKVDMEKQKKLLASSLTYVVDHLHETDKLVSYLQKLGVRHQNYGTKPEHLDWIGETLLATLAHVLGAKWTDELKNEWITAYGIVAEHMTIGLLQTKEEDEPIPP